MASVSDYLSSKGALVMTPDGRQVTQAQYDSERQRADQTAKLNSLISAPLAAGAYGALDQLGANPETRDRITGILAGAENIAQAGGGMGMPRQSVPLGAPKTSVQRTAPGSVGNRFRPPPSNAVSLPAPKPKDRGPFPADAQAWIDAHPGSPVIVDGQIRWQRADPTPAELGGPAANDNTDDTDDKTILPFRRR